MRLSRLSFGLLISLLWAGAPAAKAAPAQSYETLSIVYRGSLLGIGIMHTQIGASIGEKTYAIEAQFRTAGLVAMIKSFTIKAGAQGLAGLRPTAYWHQENDGHKNRRLEITYGPQNVSLTVTPPLSSMGAPPATQIQRREALDPLSALLALATLPPNDQGVRCTGTIKVFDGKKRYDLRLHSLGQAKVRTRAYKGTAEHCTVFYVPIAGFDADDKENKDAYEKPVHMWLASAQGGHAVPVRFAIGGGLGKIVIEARRITFGHNPQ